MWPLVGGMEATAAFSTCSESPIVEERTYSCGQGGWDCKDQHNV